MEAQELEGTRDMEEEEVLATQEAPRSQDKSLRELRAEAKAPIWKNLYFTFGVQRARAWEPGFRCRIHVLTHGGGFWMRSCHTVM